MKRKDQLVIWMIMLVCLMISSSKATAQDTTATKAKCHLLVEAYMMFPNMKGTVGLSTLPDASVDEDPGDIFENFQFGAMLYAELYKDLWAFTSDFTYMSLGSFVEGKNGILSGKVDLKQLAWELAALRRLKPWLEAGVGFQLNNIKSDILLYLNSPGAPSTSKGLNETWVDPSLIARIKLPLSTKWLFQFRGNIGGFGIGSDLYWQLQTYFGYRFSKLFQLSAGYRVIDMDYENGNGSDRFKYDMKTFGPVVRLGFNLK